MLQMPTRMVIAGTFHAHGEPRDKMGLQIFVHRCGDGAARRTLDGYEAVQKANGKRDSRHRIEHIDIILMTCRASNSWASAIDADQPRALQYFRRRCMATWVGKTTLASLVRLA